MIGKAIVHSQVEVRGWAFSVLCQVKRKTVEPSARETEMIKRFLTENLSEDHITFRQNFTSDFTVLIVRYARCLSVFQLTSLLLNFFVSPSFM